MDLTINFENKKRLNIRMGAIIEHNGRYLVYRDNHANYEYFIGGRVQLNESSLEAIHREIVEELNEEVDVERLLFVTENFFFEETLALNYHELGYYYLVHLPATSRYLRSDTTLFPNSCEVKWVTLEHEVMSNEIFKYIKEHGIEKNINHLIFRDK